MRYGDGAVVGVDFSKAEGEEIRKGRNDWKNITENQTDVQRGNRKRRQGMAAISGGATLGGAGLAMGGGPVASDVVRSGSSMNRAVSTYNQAMPQHKMGLKSRAQAVGNAGKNAFKRAPGGFRFAGPKTGAALIGAGSLAALGGVTRYGHGHGQRAGAEKRITRLRRVRDAG